MLICKCGKVSDWSSIAPPLPPCGARPSVSNVIVKSEDLSEVTLCNMLNFINFNQDLNLCSGQVNMQLCGFHCIPGYSISVSTSNFIHFTCLHVVSQGFPEDQVHQMCSDSIYFNYFSLYYYRSVQNGVFCVILVILTI